MSEISLQMYTLRNHMKTLPELEDTLRRVAGIGYKNVQISVPAFTTVEQVAELLNKYGLSADSVFAPSLEITRRMDEILNHSKALKTRVLRTDSIPADWAKFEQGFRDYAKVLNEAGRALKENGMEILYYHFHAFEWIRFESGVRGIDILLNETDPDCVGFQPDVFWLTSAGTEPSESIGLFKGRAAYMHVKDYAITARTEHLESVPRAYAPVGQGNLNWPRLIPAARAAGIRRFVVEQDECQGDEFARVRESFEALNRMGVH